MGGNARRAAQPVRHVLAVMFAWLRSYAHSSAFAWSGASGALGSTSPQLADHPVFLGGPAVPRCAIPASLLGISRAPLADRRLRHAELFPMAPGKIPVGCHQHAALLLAVCAASAPPWQLTPLLPVRCPDSRAPLHAHSFDARFIAAACPTAQTRYPVQCVSRARCRASRSSFANVRCAHR